MDRREFLTGLFGVATVVAGRATTVALSQPTSEDWLKAVMEVHRKVQQDLWLFGNGFSQCINEFPYIRHVPLSEVYIQWTSINFSLPPGPSLI